MTILIEDHSSGTSLIQELKNEYIGCIEECRPGPGSDKNTRFVAQSPKFE
jgi:phage terminase large subunit-like protein